MAREPIPMWCFAIVVVRHADKFLLVQEVKHEQRWYLPAGRVELGESFEQAAVRETLEEAGIEVRPLGILRIEHSPESEGARLRVIFLAEPIDDTPPKQFPDSQSMQARWVTLDELAAFPLRGPEVPHLFEFVAAGGKVFPLSVMQPERNPF